MAPSSILQKLSADDWLAACTCLTFHLAMSSGGQARNNHQDKILQIEVTIRSGLSVLNTIISFTVPQDGLKTIYLGITVLRSLV